MPRNILPPAYLGDGVYIKDDGYQLKIAANHPDNEGVYLESEVIVALLAYIEKSKIIQQS